MKKYNYKDNYFAILGVLFLIVYGLINYTLETSIVIALLVGLIMFNNMRKGNNNKYND